MTRERRSVFVETVDTVTRDAIHRGVAQLTTTDAKLDGRSFRARQGEGHRDLVFLAHAATWGSRCIRPSSKGRNGPWRATAASFPPHGLSFRSASTTPSKSALGHMAAVPVLVRPQDAILLDQQVHASVQTAAQLAKGQGAELAVIPHNHLGQLERRVRTLRARHERVWYLLDGVYSMFGNVPPLEELVALCEKYRQLHLYIDDAHGMSWAGDRGCGLTLSRLGRLGKRMVMATSLAKGFGCGGGVLVFGHAEWARLVRNCGGPMVFSGPFAKRITGARHVPTFAYAQLDDHYAQDVLKAL